MAAIGSSARAMTRERDSRVRPFPGLALALAMSLGLAAAGSPAGAVTKTVDVQSLSFSPATVNISVGDTVKWVWVAGSHSTTSGTCAGDTCTFNGLWDSGILSSGQFLHTFDAPGSYPYYCRVHKSSMTGVVNVSGPQPLQAQLAASPTCGAAPLQVVFTGGASGGQSPYQFLWDFGDASGSAEQSPVHIYASAGSYTAGLQATDADGTTDSASVTITARDTAVSTITKVRKLTSPFRLVILGTGFPIHPEILIDGQPVPRTKYVSSTKLVALKGAALKAMVPKNQSVVITVRDTDTGVVGCPRDYMRMNAPQLGAGDAPQIGMEDAPAP